MRTVLTFYRRHGLPALFTSGVSAYAFWLLGSPYAVVYLFWIKLITDVLIGLFFHLFRAGERYLYYNLGFSIQRLYLAAFIVDMALWAGIITLVWQAL